METGKAPEMRIVQACEADARRITCFYEALIDKMSDHPYRPKWVKGIYPSYEDIWELCSGGSFSVAVREDAILGAVAVVHGGNQSHEHVAWGVKAAPDEISTLHLLAVAPEVQGRGIGFLLLKHAEGLCRQRGSRVIRLDALPENVPGNSLYRACGFSLVATDARFYESVGSIDFNYYELTL